MICVRCKNEKWDQDTCPNCGLGEKEALLTQAEILRSDGNISSAIVFYDKYLHLNPENMEVLGQRGICEVIEAVSLQDENLFLKADQDLNDALKNKWSWERGHQARIELYFGFDRSDLLLEEYEKISSADDFRKPLCLELIKIIKLTKKFKENPPTSVEIEDQDGISLIFKSFWPSIFGVPVLLWIAYKITSLPHALEEGNAVILSFVFCIVFISIIVLVYLSMRMYKKNRI